MPFTFGPSLAASICEVNSQGATIYVLTIQVPHGAFCRGRIIEFAETISLRLPSVAVRDKPASAGAGVWLEFLVGLNITGSLFALSAADLRDLTGPTSEKRSWSCCSETSYGMLPTAAQSTGSRGICD